MFIKKAQKLILVNLLHMTKKVYVAHVCFCHRIQRNMEKSKEGIFSLNLMLYPGKYEVSILSSSLD
jgi:hypothetical protein